MKLDISNNSLPVYEALASNVRLAIINCLSEKSMNIRELAEAVNLSSAIMTMHIKKLEKSGIIRTEMVPGKAGVQKLCILNVESITIVFPSQQSASQDYHETELSVGHYTDFDVEPTCGLATKQHIIGEFDEPRYFLDPERVNAKILWFSKGFIEYKVPNFLLTSENPTELEISLELSSEAPFIRENWPSDITFSLNGVDLGKWTSPGDFGDRLGKYTPEWWPRVVNQYGLLKYLKINSSGTYIDGKQISKVTIDDLNIRSKQWTFKLAVDENSENVGGVTIFGKNFGNYNQDIIFRLYYTKTV
ncbi:ArsR family transcriptional regulator [Alkalihalobacillus sp. LMS39]|uniref:ArsR/SmtB family transcription factor n=1 Tax=Alkalihalobacillus sp. LMS39 TaxID=2924032 RepID=UPI001FB1A659|nr:ArsR family transcriptional regulator [Alkalihalobacillus sp. LMS39]UOE93564.1 ArsR family transcriptional regulator [Alkalihalobacillus sp. LMS39]